jgi:Flp pilus assembly protein TadG
MIAIGARLRSLARARRGQALVESALMLPVFLLVVFGVLDLGRIVFLQAQLENAVREGARAGRVMQSFNTSTVQNRVKSQAGLSGANVTASCSSPCGYGSTVTVTATLPVSVVVGLVPAPAIPLSASASVRIE